MKLEVTMAEAAAACRTAVAELRWKVEEQTEWRLVCKELQPAALASTTWSAKIEIDVRGVDGGTLVEVKATNFGLGPIQSNHVRGQAGAFCNQLRVVLDRRVAPSGDHASGEGLTSELERLSSLRAKGLLTQGEFDIVKANLLGRIDSGGTAPVAPFQQVSSGSLPTSEFPMVPSRAATAAVAATRVIQIPCPIAIAYPTIREYMSQAPWVPYGGAAPGLLESKSSTHLTSGEWLTVRVRDMGPARPNETEIELTAWAEKAFSGGGLLFAAARRSTKRILTAYLDQFEKEILPRLPHRPAGSG